MIFINSKRICKKKWMVFYDEESNISVSYYEDLLNWSDILVTFLIFFAIILVIFGLFF